MLLRGLWLGVLTVSPFLKALQCQRVLNEIACLIIALTTTCLAKQPGWKPRGDHVSDRFMNFS